MQYKPFSHLTSADYVIGILSGFTLVVITYLGNSYFHLRKDMMLSSQHGIKRIYMTLVEF